MTKQAFDKIAEGLREAAAIAYHQEKRREAFRAGDSRGLSKNWTEEEWVKVGKHSDPLTGAIVYHSFADYCMD